MSAKLKRASVPKGADAPAYNVERRALVSLKPYEHNPKTHSPEQLKAIAASIKSFGWTMPVLIDENDGIIAGHGRAEAAHKHLSLEDVPVIVARGWTDAQKRAYVIADNKLTEMGAWDDDLLRQELSALQDEGFDLALTGFDDAEFSALFAGDDPTDVSAEWKGMPEFTQADKTAFRSIPVHFKDQAAVDAFAKKIGQKITDATRFVWFPEIEIETYADKAYGAE